MRAHSVPAAALRLCTLALLAACSDEYSVEIEFADGDARANTARIETAVVASCAEQGRGGRPVGALISSVSSPSGGPALGDIAPGEYGLYARAVDEDCVALAAGCTPISVNAGEGGRFRVVLTATEGLCTELPGCPAECAPTRDGAMADATETDAGADEGTPDAGDRGVDLAIDRGIDRGVDEGVDEGVGPTDMGVVLPEPLVYFDCSTLEAGGIRDLGEDRILAECADGCASIVPGPFGNACAFDGSGMRFRIADRDDFRPSAFTVAVWIRAERLGSMSVVSVPFGPDNLNTWQIFLPRETDALRVRFISAALDEIVIAGDAPFPLDTWTHVAITFDGINASLFVDGERRTQRDFAEFASYDGGPFLFGADENEGMVALPFTGQLDELRMYGSALSNEQVRALLTPE